MTYHRICKLWFFATLVMFVCVARSEARNRSQPESAIVAVLREMYPNEEGDVRYFLKWFDLNGDGTPEAIVHVAGPGACGTGGCDTHIFARSGDRYKLVSTIHISRPLIIAGQRRSHGWRNLMVLVAGGGNYRAYYAELWFNGRRYPGNPSVRPAAKISGPPRGTVLIKDYKFYTEGMSLKPSE